MRLGALENYMIEELFRLRGIGANFSKYRGEVANHQTNAVRNAVDVDRYANACISGAYFNLHGKSARRHFNDPAYGIWSSVTGRKEFEYFLRLQSAGKNNSYFMEIRKKLSKSMEG